MSRDGRDDDREWEQDEVPDRTTAASSEPVDLPLGRLDLPRTEVREPVVGRDGSYQLSGSDSRMLATIGAFRVVPEGDLARSPEELRAVRRLADQGLVTRHTVPINRVPTRVVVLSRDGHRLLADRTPPDAGPRQEFHAGLVKPRELGHDAQLYRLFQAEAGRLLDEGATLTRVVLDYELKREYQTFLNDPNRPRDTHRETEVEAFAARHGLPVIDGHLELPDVRIEYLTPDGRLETRDLELVTEHYSRSQLAGKARAGFSCYRAGGARIRGGGSKTGGTPLDPHLLERL